MPTHFTNAFVINRNPAKIVSQDAEVGREIVFVANPATVLVGFTSSALNFVIRPSDHPTVLQLPPKMELWATTQARTSSLWVCASGITDES